MAVNIEQIKILRTKTGAGMMDCKNVLAETDGDLDKALELLMERGAAIAEKKATRVAAEGIVDSYIHANGRIGVLIEVNIETDFAAKNEDFRSFVKELCLQIAAMSPRWVTKDEVPAEVLEQEREDVRAKAIEDGKPEKIIDKIVDGSIKKFYNENCLLEQAFVKDDSKTCGALLTEMIAKIGEKISVRRFARYEMGEGLQKREDDFAEEVMKQAKG